MLKLFFIVGLLFGYLNACTGDCFSCHQSLLSGIEKDDRHKSMKICANCHSPNPKSMAECGPDCFSCHPKEKLESGKIKEHAPIKTCRECHMKKNKMFDISNDNFNQSFLRTQLLN